MVFALDTTLSFPDPHLDEPDGLLAVGGDLSVDRMLLAYSYGIFPWYSFRYNREILWYCPMQRFVIFPSEVHVSHSMRSLMSRGTYHVTFNQDFDEVIRRCSRLRIKEDGAWLGVDMVKAYRKMHEQGFAASVEVWQSDRLVGGLYGVLWREYVFVGSQCQQASSYPLGTLYERQWRFANRLPVRNAPPTLDGWALHRLRRLP